MIGWMKRALPERWKGWFEHWLGHHRTFYPWGSAFNGQTVRTELCRRAIRAFRPECIIETGTYRGTTTEYLAQFGIPVITFESHPRFHEFASRRLARFRHVEVIFGASHEQLPPRFPNNREHKRVFAYLDAHWYHHLPLREEISDLARITDEFIILIDDFQVPTDAGYQYDDYGPVGSCTVAFIAPALGTDMAVYFPVIPAAHETGVRRGYCFVARGATALQVLDASSELQRAP
jgi:hypothetical protein